MKLLILTQIVNKNDSRFGFIHDWISEFAKHCESIVIICLYKGNYTLPSNVRVLSLGKENGQSRLKYVFRFYKYVWNERRDYDSVFIHMNQIYVVLGGILWRLWKKKVALWFVHKSINLKLKIAEKFVNIIFTASKESFQLKSDKVKILGHGININKFKILGEGIRANEKNRIIYVGRISKIKNQDIFIEAINILINNKGVKDIKAKLIGNPVFPKDIEYKEYLKELIITYDLKDFVEFTENVPSNEMPIIYNQSFLNVNLCPTGGLDKAVLEAMACGCLVITSNKSFKSIVSSELILDDNNSSNLAEKILWLTGLTKSEKENIIKGLRAEVVERHNLSKLIKEIIKFY